jgi:hypothetical protein
MDDELAVRFFEGKALNVMKDANAEMKRHRDEMRVIVRRPQINPTEVKQHAGEVRDIIQQVNATLDMYPQFRRLYVDPNRTFEEFMKPFHREYRLFTSLTNELGELIRSVPAPRQQGAKRKTMRHKKRRGMTRRRVK